MGEAVAACARVRHLRPMSYLLADAAGGVAVVEATPGAVRVRRPEGGMVVAANAPSGGELLAEHGSVEYDPPLGPPADARTRERVAERSRRRIARVQELLGAGSVSDEVVSRILSDHEAPICAGDHAAPDGGRWGTIWSGISKPAEGVFAIAPGRPCTSDYRALQLPVSSRVNSRLMRALSRVSPGHWSCSTA